MKKIISLIVIIIVLIGFIIGLYFFGLTSVSKDSEKVKFTIEPGTSTKEVINNLSSSKLLKSRIASMIYVKLNKGIVIKAGEYELDRKYDTKKIFNILSDGKIIDNTITVTFVEGKRLTHYVDIISEKFGYSKEEILKKLSDHEYLQKLIDKYDFLDNSILNSDLYYPLEGYLFPATYEFYHDASIETILEKMLNKTSQVLSKYEKEIAESDYSNHEILTMASIIENETMVADDREVVSQVIHSRLKINMSLGMDVTTYYGAKKELSEVLTKVDIEEINAYNTRPTSFLGLPVGPICNPSEASIKAALNPSDTDYLYFYAEMATGKLHFAKTYSEFQELIRMYS